MNNVWLIWLVSCSYALDLKEIMEMMDLKKFLGGDVHVDAWLPLVKYPSLLGQFKLTYPQDLCCESFDAIGTPSCRWRNEWTICGSGDEMDFIRACGSWGDEQGDTIFNTKIKPVGPFLLAGSKKVMASTESAMLVSDPIQCQHGDGKVIFNHWTSPRVRLRVCIRIPGMGKRYDWCSEDITKSPGPSVVTIPGSIMCTFEIVIEAYNFVLNNFGQQGGMAAIDSIQYYAQAIYNCDFLPHFDPPIPLHNETCRKLNCDFDEHNCLKDEEDADFEITKEHVGSYHAGIRRPLKGEYAYARGPSSSSLEMGPLNFTRPVLLEFCYYRSTVHPKVAVILLKDSENETRVYESKESYVVHQWICETINLQGGAYESLVFKVNRMKSSYSMVGLDEIALIDPITGQSCLKQLDDNVNSTDSNINETETTTDMILKSTKSIEEF